MCVAACLAKLPDGQLAEPIDHLQGWTLAELAADLKPAKVPWRACCIAGLSNSSKCSARFRAARFRKINDRTVIVPANDSQPAENEATQGVGLEAVLAEYLGVEGGQQPDERQILEQHPELAEELRSFFLNRHEMEQFAKPLRSAGETRTAGRKNGKIRYVGDYELLREIGFGGMGVIYKSRQTSLQRTVAVKMVLEGRLPTREDRQRFRIEAEAAASLDHPNIVPIYEVGEHEGRPFFSMKLIEGGSLGQRLVAHFAGRGRARLHGDGRPGRPSRPRARHPAPRPEAGQRPARRRRATRTSPTSAWPRRVDEERTHRPRPAPVLGTPATWHRSRRPAKAAGLTTAADVYGLVRHSVRAPERAEAAVSRRRRPFRR